MDNLKEVQAKLFAASELMKEASLLLFNSKPEPKSKPKFGDIVTYFENTDRRIILYNKKGELKAFRSNGDERGAEMSRYNSTGDSIFGIDNPLKLDT